MIIEQLQTDEAKCVQPIITVLVSAFMENDAGTDQRSGSRSVHTVQHQKRSPIRFCYKVIKLPDLVLLHNLPAARWSRMRGDALQHNADTIQAGSQAGRLSR